MRPRWWSRLSRRDRRALVIGCALMIASLTALRGVPAWRSWKARATESAAAARAELIQSETVLAGFPASLDTLQARLARLRALDSALVAGGDSASVALSLSGIVAETVRGAGARVDRVAAVVVGDSTETVRRVEVDVQATGDVAALSELLRQLEGGRRLFAIRGLSVKAYDVRIPDDQPESLALRMKVGALAVIRRDVSVPSQDSTITQEGME